MQAPDLLKGELYESEAGRIRPRQPGRLTQNRRMTTDSNPILTTEKRKGDEHA
jgi:hypothetical protein